jgi:hypothetical protein
VAGSSSSSSRQRRPLNFSKKNLSRSSTQPKFSSILQVRCDPLGSTLSTHARSLLPPAAFKKCIFLGCRAVLFSVLVLRSLLHGPKVMNSQNDTRHPAIDTSKRANELAKKLTQLAKVQATSLHSSASYVEHLKHSSPPPPVVASVQIQDGINAQVLSFCARVPELLSSCGLIKPTESAHSNHEPGVALLRIAEQSSKSLQPSQNFAIVERMFDAAMKHLASRWVGGLIWSSGF